MGFYSVTFLKNISATCLHKNTRISRKTDTLSTVASVYVHLMMYAVQYALFSVFITVGMNTDKSSVKFGEGSSQ